jgi:hypothetical protein
VCDGARMAFPPLASNDAAKRTAPVYRTAAIRCGVSGSAALVVLVLVLTPVGAASASTPLDTPLAVGMFLGVWVARLLWVVCGVVGLILAAIAIAQARDRRSRMIAIAIAVVCVIILRGMEFAR